MNKKSKSIFVNVHVEEMSIDRLVNRSKLIIDCLQGESLIAIPRNQKLNIPNIYFAFANVPKMKHTPDLCTAAIIAASPRKPYTLRTCRELYSALLLMCCETVSLRLSVYSIVVYVSVERTVAHKL